MEFYGLNYFTTSLKRDIALGHILQVKNSETVSIILVILVSKFEYPSVPDLVPPQ